MDPSLSYQDGDHEVQKDLADLEVELHLGTLHLELEVDGAVVLRGLQLPRLLPVVPHLLQQRGQPRPQLSRRLLGQQLRRQLGALLLAQSHGGRVQVHRVHVRGLEEEE